MASKFWVGGTDTWNSTAGSKWATTSGGAGGTSVPTSGDDVFFDANSGSGTVTITGSRSMNGVDFTGFTGTFAGSGSLFMTEDLTLSASATYTHTGTFIFDGTSASHIITTNGASLTSKLDTRGSSSTTDLVGNWVSTNSFAHGPGTFNANNYNVTISYLSYSALAGSRTLNMGTGTWTLTSGDNDPWTVGSSTTVNPSTSTIKLTGTLTGNRSFVGFGKTYYNFWNATTGSFYITVTGSNTFNDFKIDQAREMRFTDGTTQTVASFTAIGTSGNEIVLRGSSTAGWNIAKSGGGTVEVEYCTITWSQASPSSTWFAPTDDGNTDGGNNTGWDFNPATADDVGAMMMMLQISGGLM